MDEYLTDEQEVDRAKQWLRENGAFLVAGVVLGLGGLFGWQQWENSQLEHAGKASVVWEQMRTAISGDRMNEVSETLAILESEYEGTPYLDQARLAVARMHMDRNEPEPAADQFRLLTKESDDVHIRRVAELRLAQVLLYQQQAEEALEVLGQGDATAFAGQFHELRGDAYFALGEFEDARDAYERALATTVEGVINREYVSFKLEDVKGLLLANAPIPAEEPLADAVEAGTGAEPEGAAAPSATEQESVGDDS